MRTRERWAFLAAAVMTGLYIAKTGDFNKKKTESSRQISDLRDQIDALNKKLSDANQKQSGTQSQLDEVTKEKNTIGNCLSLLEKALQQAADGDRNGASATASQAQQPCDDAQKYLN